MSPIQIYNDNVGHTHETAVAAVYNAGFADGYAKAVADLAPPPTPETPVETPPEPSV